MFKHISLDSSLKNVCFWIILSQLWTIIGQTQILAIYSWLTPLTTNILLNGSLFLLQQYYWVLVFTMKKKYITKAAKQAKHNEFNLIWAKKGHGKFWGSFSYQLITLIILMLWRKGNMILKVDRHGFLLVPKSGPKLINMMEILLFKTYSHFCSRTLYKVSGSKLC